MSRTEGVREQPSSGDEISGLFAVYRRHLQDARVDGLSADGAYCQLFDAGLTLAKIVIRSHGWRVTGSHMNHATVLQLCESALASATPQSFRVLDRARRKRNQAVYDEAGVVTRVEMDALRLAVADLECAAHAWLASEHPALLPPELPLG